MRDMFNEREYTTMLRFYDADFVHMPEEMQIMAKTFIEEIHRLEDKAKPVTIRMIDLGLVCAEKAQQTISDAIRGLWTGFNPYSDDPQPPMFDEVPDSSIEHRYVDEYGNTRIKLIKEQDVNEPDYGEVEIDPAWMM